MRRYGCGKHVWVEKPMGNNLAQFCVARDNARKPNPEMEKSLSDASEETEVRYLPEGGKLVDHLAGVEVIYGRIREEEFQTATDLKSVHQPFASAEGHMFPAFKQSDVILTNCAGLFGQQISEHAFALLFSLTRRILDQYDFMKRKHWEILPCFEMAGGTMGIVGLGGIGGPEAHPETRLRRPS